MASINKRYDVVAGRPYTTRDGEDKKQWINVGRAVEWDDGGISIELHAVPVGSWFDGKLSLFEQRERSQGAGSGGSRGGAPQRERPARATDQPRDDFEDDSIPFVTNRGAW